MFVACLVADFCSVVHLEDSGFIVDTLPSDVSVGNTLNHATVPCHAWALFVVVGVVFLVVVVDHLEDNGFIVDTFHSAVRVGNVLNPTTVQAQAFELLVVVFVVVGVVFFVVVGVVFGATTDFTVATHDLATFFTVVTAFFTAAFAFDIIPI